MAIVSTRNPSSLKLSLDCGVNEKGKNILRTKTINNVKYEATDDDIYEVVNSLIGLQGYDLKQVYRIDSSSLSE